jgi:hypothetical protein
LPRLVCPTGDKSLLRAMAALLLLIISQTQSSG